MSNTDLISVEKIDNAIYVIRGETVMRRCTKSLTARLVALLCVL